MLVDLWLANSSGSTATLALLPPGEDDKVFSLALHAIRIVHVRRNLSDKSGDGGGDPYKYLLDKLPQNHFNRNVVLLDRLGASIAAVYDARQGEDEGAARRLDRDTLRRSKDFMAVVKTFFEKSAEAQTTLFAESSQAMVAKLLGESKAHLSRAVSLYHSEDAHGLCSEYSTLLVGLLDLQSTISGLALPIQEAATLKGNVLAILANSLTLSNKRSDGVSIVQQGSPSSIHPHPALVLQSNTARRAWEKAKNVDTLVALFHTQLRHNAKDALLTFDAALGELLASQPSESISDEVLAAFPRLSNACVENEENGGGPILLGIQERWIDFAVQSKSQNAALEERTTGDGDPTSVGLFQLAIAYLDNLERVISETEREDTNAISRSLDALGRVVDGVLKVLVQVRNTEQPTKKSAGRKKKNSPEAQEPDLIWDDDVVKRLIGDRKECLHLAELIWNISHQLLGLSASPDCECDARGVAADLFAAGHDFCILSDEEPGKALSKSYLDFDIKNVPSRQTKPLFGKARPSGDGATDRTPCDISSEVSTTISIETPRW